MIVETSAVIAIVAEEPEWRQLTELVRADAGPKLSAASYLEVGIVVDSRRDPWLSRQVDAVLGALDIEVVAVTANQARLARQAFRDFGKGSGHRAQLNFGDCFAYALAAETGEPLLYKGEDFAHAGVRSALPN